LAIQRATPIGLPSGWSGRSAAASKAMMAALTGAVDVGQALQHAGRQLADRGEEAEVARLGAEPFERFGEVPVEIGRHCLAGDDQIGV
jgi:hypothetical protein